MSKRTRRSAPPEAPPAKRATVFTATTEPSSSPTSSNTSLASILLLQNFAQLNEASKRTLQPLQIFNLRLNNLHSSAANGPIRDTDIGGLGKNLCDLLSAISTLTEIVDKVCPPSGVENAFSCPVSCPVLPPPAPAKNYTENSIATDPPPSTPRPSYASVAVGTPALAALAPNPPDTSPHSNHTPSSFQIPHSSRPKGQALKSPVLNPVRLVVRPAGPRFDPKPFASLLCFGPAEPYRRLSHSLALSPTTKDVKLLGVHVNRSQNLIISLPHGTSDSAAKAVSTVALSAFGSTTDRPLLISRDVAWTKLMVSSVPTRLNPGSPVYSEEEVQDSFLLNPSIQALSITRAPRWVRNPASITGAHSSFTFSFQDPDGSLGRSLAKCRLFIFGKPVHLKRWTDKPRQTRGAADTKVSHMGPAPGTIDISMGE